MTALFAGAPVSALLLAWEGAELIADETGSLSTSLGSRRHRRAEPALELT
jgi:hypothetical protein